MAALKLKPRQADALNAALDGDCLCVLPTGYGKTLIIKNLPLHSNNSWPSCVLAVNPLCCIMDQQEQIFGQKCYRVTEKTVTCSDETLIATDMIKSGDVQYIIAHPEQAIHDTFKKIIMETSKFVKVSHIVVDEAHCVLSWGLSDFRPAYKKLGTLRAILPEAKMLSLTATATAASQKEIIKQLNMINPKIIKESPDRPNVYLNVKRRPASTGGNNTAQSSMFSIADIYLQELKETKLDFPKTVVYIPLKWCGILHERASAVFDVGAFVAQYHAPQSQQMKIHIVDSMKAANSQIRLLLATEACGMGVDIPDIRRVVHITLPSTIETFIQEVCRCGRDGKPSDATLYWNNNDVGKNLTHIQEEMRSYTLQDGCRRKYLLDYFGFPVVNTQPRCCDNCSQQESEVNKQDLGDRIMLKPTEVSIARQLLQNYFTEENKLAGTLIPQLKTGLSSHLVEKIVSMPVHRHVNALHRELPALDLNYTENISKILKHVQSMSL